MSLYGGTRKTVWNHGTSEPEKNKNHPRQIKDGAAKPIISEETLEDIINEFYQQAGDWKPHELETALLTYINKVAEVRELEARFVELDLWEQAINQGLDVYVFKMKRLNDLSDRLEMAKDSLLGKGK